MMELEAARVPLFAAGVLTAAVGMFLVAVRFRYHPMRAFGLILVLLGLAWTSSSFLTHESARLQATILAGQPYLLLPIIPLVAYLASTFPTRQGLLAFRGSGWLVISFIGLLELLYLVNHQTVYTLSSSSGAAGVLRASSNWYYADFGPLLIFFAPVGLSLSMLGLLYARRYQLGSQDSPTIFLIASGLILNGIFNGGFSTALLIQEPSLVALPRLGWLFPISGALALLPACMALGMLISGREGSNRWTWQWTVPALAVAAILSGPLPVFLGADGYGTTWQAVATLSFWRLIIPLTIGYALIRSGMLEHVRLPHLWPRGHHKAAARPAASARSTED